MHYKVYLILAHKKPNQLLDLISLLQDEHSYFFIHIDKKVSLDPFKNKILSKKCVFIKKRIKCNWGNYSLVQATLNTMNEIKEYMEFNFPKDSYHCIILSGEDLPLKSNDALSSFFNKQPDVSFIHHWKLPYKNWWGGGFFRFESLYLFNSIKYPKSHYWFNKIIKKLKLGFLLPSNQIKRKFPKFVFYGSSQWMILSKELMHIILDLSHKNKDFNRFFKFVLAPDELYFPSLIYHFNVHKICKIVNFQTHLALFIGNNANPQYLSIEDLKTSQVNTALFARKFDATINPDTIDLVIKRRKQ